MALLPGSSSLIQTHALSKYLRCSCSEKIAQEYGLKTIFGLEKKWRAVEGDSFEFNDREDEICLQSMYGLNLNVWLWTAFVIRLFSQDI